MTETATVQVQEDRTFWPSDYGRVARAIRQVRREAGQDPEKCAAADDLASAATSVFADDSPEFDPALFDAATHDVPAYVRRFAEAVRRARLARGGYEPKAGEHQAAVDALAGALASVLGDSVPGFSEARFHEGSKAPEQPQRDDSDDERPTW